MHTLVVSFAAQIKVEDRKIVDGSIYSMAATIMAAAAPATLKPPVGRAAAAPVKVLTTGATGVVEVGLTEVVTVGLTTGADVVVTGATGVVVTGAGASEELVQSDHT